MASNRSMALGKKHDDLLKELKDRSGYSMTTIIRMGLDALNREWAKNAEQQPKQG